MGDQPNVLFVMCDQLRGDMIHALGNRRVYTPNLDRLVRRGVSFSNAYASCPICVPARYTIRTGCDSPTTGYFHNHMPDPGVIDGTSMEGRCGPYLARRMTGLGYRTFGIGKFHTHPRYEDLGYETMFRAEEGAGPRDLDGGDAYYTYIRKRHPEYDHIEQLHGERSDMYIMPQANPLPPELNHEAFCADRAVDQIAPRPDDDRPFFGFVSFIGPHPPLAPPVPFNRLYHPDRMPPPVVGDPAVDHADGWVAKSRYAMFANDMGPGRIAACRARYYGEVTYIDWCIGKVLDAVDARPDADNTLIVFYSDHGEALGDHDAVQKETFFEPSARVPLLVSWPAKLTGDRRFDGLAALSDLYGIATAAAGAPEFREGHDQLGALLDDKPNRERVVGWFGRPGTREFKTMIRRGPWKYMYFANGARELLFNVDEDPWELRDLSIAMAERTAAFRDEARATMDEAAQRPGCPTLLEGGQLPAYEFKRLDRVRIVQMAPGVKGYPDHPSEVVDQWRPRYRTEYDGG